MNIVYEYAIKYFKSYVKDNFDLENEKILHKLNHTYNVVDNARYICENLKLSGEEVDLAMTIALLHDIGRFVLYKESSIFGGN